MRTWMLAPDGVWSEVTGRVADRGDQPGDWTWTELVAAIGPAEAGPVMVVDRADLAQVHAHLADRWIANRIWDTLCGPGIDSVTVVRVAPSDRIAWLAAVADFAGRPEVGEPHYAWRDRRGRWLLWAHGLGVATPALDGAYLAVGAIRAR